MKARDALQHAHDVPGHAPTENLEAGGTRCEFSTDFGLRRISMNHEGNEIFSAVA